MSGEETDENEEMKGVRVSSESESKSKSKSERESK